MSNYSKTTDFEAKDSLPTGDSGKIIRGAEFETEFDAISTAIGTKADTAGPTFTGTLTFETISDGTIGVTAFVDEDNMSSDSATLVPTQQSVKAYVDSQVTAQDLDFQADSGGALSIDLDSEALTFTGGTGVDTSGSGNAVTFAIDSTVATLTGSQTLTNKTLTSPDVNTPDIDGGTIDGTVIGGATPAAVSATTVSATGNITVGGTVDGRDVATDGTKLDGIEASATADQTAAEIRTLVGSASDSNVFTDADHSKLDGIEASATADQTAAEIRTLVESASDSNVFTDADHTKLNAIEASATADQTDAEIRAAVEAATDSNVFTDADHTKLNAIEASADVTDTANVTAAGALMDSELTDLTAVKALNQGVATTDSPTFAGLTTTADVSFGDNDKAIFGAGSDLQIYHDGSNSYIDDAGTGLLAIRANSGVYLQKYTGETLATFVADAGAAIYFDNAARLATTSTGIDVTGTVTADGLTVDGTGTFTTADNSAQVTLISTDTDALVGPQLNLWRNSGTGTNGDLIGQITFTGEDTVGSTNTFASIYSVADQTNNGSEDGSIHFQTLINGVLADRLEINSAGNTVVTGTVTADGLTVDASSPDVIVKDTQAHTTSDGPLVQFQGKGPNGTNYNFGYIQGLSNGSNNAGDMVLGTNTAGVQYQRMRLEDNGDISFYEDTGTTAKLFWDASAESLGIGTSSPSSKLHVANAATEEYIFETTNNNTRSQVEIKSKDSSGNAVQTRIGSIGDGVYGMLYTFTNHNLSFATNNAAPQMTLDTSGNVGIGVAPSSPLHVNVGTNQNLEIDSAGSELRLSAVNDARSTNPAIRFQAESYKFYGAGGVGPRATIDSSGNLLVGKTSTSSAIAGTTLWAGGYINSTVSADYVARFNRLTSDGEIVQFQKDSTTVGSIQTNSGRLDIQGAGNTVRMQSGTSMIQVTNGTQISLETAGSERMRIDASGDVIVGGTSSGANDAVSISNTGYIQAIINDDIAGYFNRRTSDGEILRLQKDGTTVGSIGAFSSRLFIGSGDTGIFFDPTTDDAIKPWNTSTNAGRDAAIDLGDSGTRFKNLYLAGGAQIGDGANLTWGGSYGAGNPTIAASSSFIAFYPEGNVSGEAFRVDASGNLLVGGTSLGDSNSFGVSSSGNITIARASGTPRSMIDFKNGGASVGSVTTSTTATTYNTTSDQRLKDNIVDAPSASDDIDAIQVRSFDWKTNGSHQKYGMVAQELSTVAPEAVSAPEDPEEMMGVDYSKLVPMLVKEIQSLRARVAQLETN